MSYNLSEVAAANNLLGVFDAANTASGGVLANMALLTIFVGVFSMALLRQNPAPESVFFASAVVSVASFLFVYMGLVVIVWPVAAIITMIISGIALYLRK